MIRLAMLRIMVKGLQFCALPGCNRGKPDLYVPLSTARPRFPWLLDHTTSQPTLGRPRTQATFRIDQLRGVIGYFYIKTLMASRC